MPFVVVQVFANAVCGLLARHAGSDRLTYFEVGGTNYLAGAVQALPCEWPASLLAVYQGVQCQLGYLAVAFTMVRRRKSRICGRWTLEVLSP